MARGKTTPPLITKAAITGAVNAAEQTFEECWSILVSLKSAKPDDRLPQFQPLLAAELLRLRRVEGTINREKATLISRKRSYSKSRFSSRMRALAIYKAILDKTAAVGRGLGDAFAWFFYTNDRELLAEHAKHTMIRSLPEGIGGLGELEFLRGVGKIQGKLILYHGITTILRLGDISLIDLATWRVVALGELKTKEESPGRLLVRCHYVGSRKRWRPRTVKAPGEAEPLPPAIQARLVTQMKRMAASFSLSLKRIPATTARLNGEMYYEALSEVVSDLRGKEASYVHAGRGLLLCGIPLPGRTLNARLQQLSVPRMIARLKKLDPQVMQLFSGPSPLNALYVSGIYWHPHDELFPSFLIGTVPQFWWPLNPTFMRRLLFLEAIVVTLFNPAHLLEELQSVGYSVSARDSEGYNIHFEHGKKKADIHNFSYFRRLVSEALHSEKLVTQLMKKSTTSILKRSKRFPPHSQVDIHYSQGLYPGALGENQRRGHAK